MSNTTTLYGGKAVQTPLGTPIRLLDGSRVAHAGTIAAMHDVAGHVIADTPDGRFLAWDLVKDGPRFVALSWRRM